MLLALDTSSKACSCAVFENEQLLAEGYLNCGLTHSATLTALIENTMKTARKSFDEIDSIALTVGPGSYTGLRIALSAAKGMAMVKKLPCIPVSTLLSLAYNLTMYNGVVCAALDARVGQVFAALFEVKNGKVTRLTDDAAITLAELGELLPNGAAVCGDGARLVVKSFPEKELILPPDNFIYQRAASAALAAFAENIEAVPADELEAKYHRKSQAEREREAKMNNPGGK